MRRIMALLLAIALLLAGCAAMEVEREASPEETEANARVYQFAMVVKDTTNPYMQHMFAGFETACGELGAEALLAGPNTLSAEAQAQSIAALIDQGVDAIAVAANDRDVLSEVLGRAIQAGIQVVSLDSNVNVDDRMVHIQQVAPDILGRVLIQAACEMVGGQGKAAILTTTDSMPNQSLWVSWMLREIEENPSNYENFKIVDIAYGMDEYGPSRRETRRLLRENPDLDIIIAPTTMGIRAAAEVISEEGSEVLVTGLGLPSDMAEYILSGVCPWMYLWNPIDVGYISAYACNALVRGEITGAAGEIVNAGIHGDKRITESADGGTEIVMGNPFMFDPGNISVWREIF